MNRTIKLLIISDTFVVSGFGLIEPILAVFIKEEIIGATLFKIGLASTLYLITKSLLQIPFSRYIDSHKHKVFLLILGMLSVSIVPFIYAYANHINTIFLAQIIYGIGAGLAFPSFLSLFSTNIDRNHEGFEWSLYSTSVGLMTAGSALIGAKLAEVFGFKVTFFVVGILSLIGTLILLMLEKKDKNVEGYFKVYNKGKLVNNPHKSYH